MRAPEASRTQLARQLRRHATQAERHLWQRLRARRLAGHYFKRQQPIGPFIIDFVCPRKRLIIEVDGAQHLTQLDADRERTEFLEGLGYTVLRFTNDQVLHETAAALHQIRLSLSLLPSLSVLSLPKVKARQSD